ncbi:type II toxin-antitoxin system Rv0910 family toxin [Williamsia herbipolensis]|uniref:type II toxin-antitoxin system Rv0910 family toxin n=1 Tax=Williamsia herbipolensis TaxID=1603258 RepID=UPI0005F7A018|nr:SRPBCC family protein [Williamsia herbipolensis]
MASVSESVEVPLSPDDAWTNVSDLSRYEEWLTIHDGWRSEVPTRDQLAKGLKIASVVAVKGTRVRFEWTVDKFDPPNIVALKGNGKGGVKVKLSLTSVKSGDGSKVTIDLDLGGLPMMGPAGKAAAKLVTSDLRESLAKFQKVFAE